MNRPRRNLKVLTRGHLRACATSLTLLLLLISIACAPTDSSAQVENIATSFSASERLALNQTNFVFVGGYGNEAIPGYFDSNMDELKKVGVENTSKLMPPTANSVRQNLDFVRIELLKRFLTGGQRPLTIIAHSKGGLEVLNTLLRYPDDFPSEVVAQVVLVQAPVKGSPYADQIMANWDHSIYAMSPLYWVNRQMQYGGFTSLTTREVKSDLESSRKFSNTAQLTNLSSRLFYWRSRKPTADVSESLTEFAKAIQQYGDSDGVVPTANEFLDHFAEFPKFGTDLGVVDGVDHLDVVAQGALPSRSRLRHIREFTDWMLKFSIAERPDREVSLNRGESRSSRSCENLF